MRKFEVYQDKRSEWRWRYLQNGQIMADSGEGYATKFGALRAIRFLGLNMTVASIVEINPQHLNGETL